MKRTREQAIELLTDRYGYFSRDEIETPAMEFWIKDLMRMEINCECMTDIDRHAWLNTLFGYDIGFYSAMKIDNWLWGSEDENGEYRDIETLSIGYKDKSLIQRCAKELGLDLSFDKWATKEPDVYQYEF